MPGSPGRRGSPALPGPFSPPTPPDVGTNAPTQPPWGGEQDAACSGALQSAIQLSDAGRRHGTFPRVFFLHKHTREALQGGMHELRTGGRGAPCAPVSELLAGAAAPGERHWVLLQRKDIQKGLILHPWAHRAAHPGWVTHGSGGPRLGTNSLWKPSTLCCTKASKGTSCPQAGVGGGHLALGQWQRPSGSPQGQEINQLSLFLN